MRNTPQQNGIAERMNRTLLNKVRCMLVGSEMSKPFWWEALNTATYLINRSPSSAIEFKTQKEIWSGKLPNLNELRTFGCAAYAHNRDGKLDPKSIKCVFLGYGDGVKGYRLWALEPKGTRLIISQDVLFNENVFPYIPIMTNPAGSTRNENSEKSQQDGIKTNKFVIDTNSQVEHTT